MKRRTFLGAAVGAALVPLIPKLPDPKPTVYMGRATGDGRITAFYQTSEPDGREQEVHHGDLWFNTSTGRLARFDGVRWSCHA